ncbi:hypothetical protein HYC85_029543 [Camellia sinensis]|uniref:Retrotransposon gag domain-containing protein n=1 Tax=Camellia sinensis TaxID=4442 RepID=A0A7J7FYA6_CAMSI|nr:hypothetical protein HYC85_029543 [Camellia sinensis]
MGCLQSWKGHLPLVEFACNNSFQSSIGMALFEALYGQLCRSLVHWAEVDNAPMLGPKLVRETTEKVALILCVDTPFLTDLETQTSPVEHSVILHVVLVQKSQSRGYEPCLRTSEPSYVPCLVPEGRFSVCVHACTHFESSRFHLMASYVSVAEALSCWFAFHACHAYYIVFGIGVSPGTGNEAHFVLRVTERVSISQSPTLRIIHDGVRTPCLPSSIPERFAGGLSCQGMTIRLTGCGLCQGSSSTIASNPADTPQALWTRVDSRIEIPIVAIEIDLPVVQIDQNSIAAPTGVDEMIRQMQETMRAMQQDTIRRDEFAKQQAEIMAQQAELITRLQQQNAASASLQVPPPVGAPLPEQAPTIQNAPPNTQNTVPNIQNLQEDTNLPTGLAPPPLPPQLSKTHTLNHPDSPFEFEVDHTALKLSKLEKLFKKSQGVKAIPDIEDGYIDVAVTLPDRFKMPQIDRFDGSGDPMVHLRLFSDILRPMGLTRPQKLSLFGRTLSGVAATWYAKLEDEVKGNWDEMAEAFVAQYSYNTQIEITTRDLETTRQEPKETFSDFVTRWRAKASMMTLRPTDKDQIRMIVRNLQPKLMQRMIVIPFPTFSDLHEMGVQIEDAMKQGLIDQDREQPRRTFNRNNNAGPSGAATARASEVSVVTTIPPPLPRPMAATPFSGASGSDTQTTRFQPRGQRTFTPLYMPLTKALGQNTARITNNTVTTPTVVTDCVMRSRILLSSSIYITPSHLPKPEVFLPDCTDFLCMVDISTTQPEPTVVTTEDGTGQTSGENGIIKSEIEQSFAGGGYDPSEYILSKSQIGLGIELPETGELCMIRGNGFEQGADDQTAMEEDFANLQFFDDQEPGDAAINWFDYEESAEATGWLEDQPDVVGEP